MPKKLIRQIAEEIVKEPVRVAEKAVEQVGLKPEVEKQPEEKKLTQAEIAKRRVKAARMLAAHRVELKDIRQLERQKQIVGKPGFAQEAKKKEPLPLVAAKPKMGTRERIRGILG